MSLSTTPFRVRLSLRAFIAFACLAGIASGLLLRFWHAPTYTMNSMGVERTVFTVERSQGRSTTLVVFAVLTRRAALSVGSTSPAELSDFNPSFRERLGLLPAKNGSFAAFVVSSDGRHFPLQITPSEAADLNALRFYSRMCTTGVFLNKIAPILNHAESHEDHVLCPSKGGN